MPYKLISGDNHIDLTYLPPDVWSSQAPAKWKLLVPRVEELDDGLHWFVEGQDKGMWNGILTVRLFWKFTSKNWKFNFEEQRTSNAGSIVL